MYCNKLLANDPIARAQAYSAKCELRRQHSRRRRERRFARLVNFLAPFSIGFLAVVIAIAAMI